MSYLQNMFLGITNTSTTPNPTPQPKSTNRLILLGYVDVLRSLKESVGERRYRGKSKENKKLI